MNPAVVGMAAALSLALLAGCGSGPRYIESFSGGPPGRTNAWQVLPALPDWVEKPPAREGFLVFVTGPSHSDLPEIAAHKSQAPDVRGFVLERLRPVLGEEAAAAAAATAPATPAPREQACHEKMREGDMTPGANLASVWTLFEVPVGPILEAVPAAKRDAARAALRQ